MLNAKLMTCCQNLNLCRISLCALVFVNVHVHKCALAQKQKYAYGSSAEGAKLWAGFL
ncbi:hypothetical protein EXN66_Car015638 [Channa argus]|uniref:Uncharacterized protein n=1 Tax=Channa argus TaxID=215402 RepID=A0A6G1QBD0_CHAAH|nr:hypothetical protein EXN66_Car015638 [Channa argus]